MPAHFNQAAAVSCDAATVRIKHVKFARGKETGSGRGWMGGAAVVLYLVAVGTGQRMVLLQLIDLATLPPGQ